MTRLTKFYNEIPNDTLEEGYYVQNGTDWEAFQKLGQLEDLMGELEIDTVEGLRKYCNLHEYDCTGEEYYTARIENLEQENQALKEKQENAIVLKFNIGDYVYYEWDKEQYIMQYIGDLKFKCLSHKQGYNCDYILIGALICEEPDYKIITEAEAQARLQELRGERV